MRRPLWFALVPGILCACGPAIDLAGQTGATRLSFGSQSGGCALSYTGGTTAAPDAIDLTCPPSLVVLGDNPTFHLSAPLAYVNFLDIPQAIQDPQFAVNGAQLGQLGQYVVVTYGQGGQQVRCDPRTATGEVLYTAIPSPTSGGRFTGRFSQDAALTSCYFVSSQQPASPMALFGDFDLAAPTP